MNPIMMILTMTITMAAALAGGSARADEIPELTRYLEQETAAMAQAMGCVGAECVSSAAPTVEDAWYFRRVLIRVRPKVSFGIPGFAKMEITPETELVWDRDLPSGWTGFKPTL